MFQFRSPRQAYGLGLALILALATIQFVGSRVVADRQEVSALEINLAGRQRMLSQRIGWTLYRIADLGAETSSARYAHLRSVLAQCVHLMEQSQRALNGRQQSEMEDVLQAGEHCLTPDPLRPLPPPSDRVALGDGTILGEFTQNAWDVAIGERNGSFVLELAQTSEGPLIELLAELNQATLDAQLASTAQIKLLLSVNWILLLGLIIGEVVLIFRPMARAVEQSIDQLEETNTQLLNSEARLQGFTATAAHQLWETDKSHKFRFVAAANPDAKLTQSEKLIGKAFWEIDGASDEPSDDANWAGFKTTLDAFQPVRGFEFSTVERSGMKRWWRVNGQPVFSRNGAFVGYRGTTLEITSEKERDRRLRLSQRMTAIGQLTAGIAHDFNNILAIIQGNAELLPLEKTAEARQRNTSEIIDATERGASLTSRLLSFGRVQHLAPETIDMADFLNDVAPLLNRTLGEDFLVTVRLPDEPIRVLADRHQLEDATLNLAINARDAALPGGHLQINASIQRVIVPLIDAEGASNEKTFVKVSFADNGKGIPEDIQEKIFEPFFTTKSTGEGSGLGLSMVYGFAHQSGGFIEVSSVPANGTTIDLYLPCAAGSQSEPAMAQTEPPKLECEGMSALVVEDNAALRRIIVQQLTRLGFAVFEADDGGSAIERIKNHSKFDLLLLDIVLPGGIDGVDVAEFAKNVMPGAMVLFATGFAAANAMRPNQMTLPGPVLSKPFRMETLERELAVLLKTARNGESADCPDD
ncbi:MAG: ATP-binding protein [Pseudomonadota bacterium]